MEVAVSDNSTSSATQGNEDSTNQTIKDCKPLPEDGSEPKIQGPLTGASVGSVNNLEPMNTNDPEGPSDHGCELVKFLFYNCKKTKTFKCVECSIEFFTLDGLFSHSMIHNGGEQDSKPALVVNDEACNTLPTSMLRTTGSSGKNQSPSRNNIVRVVEKLNHLQSGDSIKKHPISTGKICPNELGQNPKKPVVLLNSVDVGQDEAVKLQGSDARKIYCVIQTDNSVLQTMAMSKKNHPSKNHIAPVFKNMQTRSSGKNESPSTNMVNQMDKKNRKTEKFKCMRCNRTFTMKHKVLQHYQITHLDEKTSENLSDMTEGSSSMNQDHSPEVKKFVGEYKCKYCDKSFPRKSSLLRHTYTMSCLGNVARPTCPSCGESFARKDSLIRHYKGCADNPDLSLLDEIEVTKPIEPISNRKRHKCLVCEEFFGDREKLSHHLRDVHELLISVDCLKGKGGYTCPVCKKGFERYCYLGVHIKFVHFPNRRPAKITCPVCDKKLKHSLEEHMRTHTGERPFMCETCGQLFSHKGALKIHRRTHTGEKPYKCNKCDKEYSCLAGLQNHGGVHTGKNTCKICGLSYSHYRGLQKHQKLKHSSGGSS